MTLAEYQEQCERRAQDAGIDNSTSTEHQSVTLRLEAKSTAVVERWRIGPPRGISNSVNLFLTGVGPTRTLRVCREKLDRQGCQEADDVEQGHLGSPAIRTRNRRRDWGDHSGARPVSRRQQSGAQRCHPEVVVRISPCDIP